MARTRFSRCTKLVFHGFAGGLGEHSGKRPRLLVAAIDHEAGHDCRGEKHEQQHDHGAPARAMAEMALGAEQHEIADVTQRVGWRVDEVGEARVSRPDETPDHASQDQHADRIARPDMHLEEIVLGQISDRKGHNQGPVEYPDERIPDIDQTRSGIAIQFEHRQIQAS
jgi:hypothetical protein